MREHWSPAGPCSLKGPGQVLVPSGSQCFHRAAVWLSQPDQQEGKARSGATWGQRLVCASGWRLPHPPWPVPLCKASSTQLPLLHPGLLRSSKTKT